MILNMIGAFHYGDVIGSVGTSKTLIWMTRMTCTVTDLSLLLCFLNQMGDN